MNNKQQSEKRVRLVPLSEDWIDRLIAWRAQEQARQHQPVQALNREQLVKFVRARRSEELSRLVDNEHILVIVDPETGEGVGWMTMEILSRLHGLARIGYTIDRDHYNQGYATAAVANLTRILFTHTDIERVEADCSVHNPASRRVLEKCGFQLVGIKRKYLVIHGQRVDHHYYELCKDDWRAD
jgi:RimJ/RimL family protein N-acetyltransferase